MTTGLQLLYLSSAGKTEHALLQLSYILASLLSSAKLPVHVKKRYKLLQYVGISVQQALVRITCMLMSLPQTTRVAATASSSGS
jgi:hypothetical protein